jgi:Ribonuclease G/E
VEEGLKTKSAPAVLLEEPDLVERSVRDFLESLGGQNITTIHGD